MCAVIALVLIAIEQFPAHGIIAEWCASATGALSDCSSRDGWLQAFGPTRGAWYSGALQITIAFAQGGMSIGFSGNSVAYTIVRYVAFWALMGASRPQCAADWVERTASGTSSWARRPSG